MNFHFELIQLTYSVVFFFIIIAVLGHILSVNKTPASTLSWVLIILVWPYFGLPLYIVFGTRKFTKKTPLLSPAPYETLIAVTDSVQRVLMASGSSAPCTNSQIKFLNGEETYHSLIELVNGAKKSIYLETFIFKNDDVGKQILGCLIKKQQDGIEVKILLDSLGAHMPGHPHFGAFIKAGGKVEMFMPIIHRPFRGMANLRNHRKLIVIDHKTVILGGMNIAEEYMGPEKNAERWVDLAMKIEGPMVYQIENVFHSDWAYATHSLPLKSQAALAPVEENKHLAQLALSGPDIEADPIYELLLTAIYGAKKRIWIATPYFVPDEALAKALELAARRGVDVTLALPFKSNHMLADLSRRTYLEQIINAGASVMTYPKMIHAKLTVVDDQYAFTGSANVDCRSLLLNYESGICLYSTEDINQMSDWMKDILSKCSPYSRRKTYLDTWISGLARLFSPIL